MRLGGAVGCHVSMGVNTITVGDSRYRCAYNFQNQSCFSLSPFLTEPNFHNIGVRMFEVEIVVEYAACISRTYGVNPSRTCCALLGS